MARTVAELPKGSRITDYISLGVLNTMIPRTAVNAALEASSRQSIRQRDLSAHVMVYYVVALALYMQSSYREVLRCLLEGLQWLSDPSARPRVVGKSGISQARTRLGAEPLQALHVKRDPPVSVNSSVHDLLPWRLFRGCSDLADGLTLAVHIVTCALRSHSRARRVRLSADAPGGVRNRPP